MMEENAQMSLLPDAAVAAQMTMTGEEEIDLSEYEIAWQNCVTFPVQRR